jgi:hypothetical protein
MDGKRKLLFISANPVPLGEVRTNVELRDINEGLRSSISGEHFEIAVTVATRRDRLQQLLLTHRPDIVHFAGHGDPKRGLLLEDEHGNPAPVAGPELAALFSIIRGKPSIVVLNACSTKRTARAFRNIVDYTIAMNGPISDISAITFAAAFYEALALGLHVPGAFGAGLSKLRLLKLPSKMTPELFIAPGVRLNAPPEHEGRRGNTAPDVTVKTRKSRLRDVVAVGGTGNIVVGKVSRR